MPLLSWPVSWLFSWLPSWLSSWLSSWLISSLLSWLLSWRPLPGWRVRPFSEFARPSTSRVPCRLSVWRQARPFAAQGWAKHPAVHSEEQSARSSRTRVPARATPRLPAVERFVDLIGIAAAAEEGPPGIMVVNSVDVQRVGLRKLPVAAHDHHV